MPPTPRFGVRERGRFMEGREKFSRREAIRFGWETMKDNLVFYVVILLVAGILTGGFSGLGRLSFDGFYPFAPFGLLSAILSVFFGIAYARISLKLVDGEKPEFTDLWESYRLFWKYLGGGILYGLIVLGGFILLIVPGVIWAIKYSQWEFFVVERGMGPVESIKASGLITRDAKWNLFVLGLMFLGVVILGALACGVGLFAAIPTVMIARAFVYRKLVVATPQIEAPPMPPTPQP